MTFDDFEQTVLKVSKDADVVSARQHGRKMATDIGFSSPDQALLTTAISELARNIVTYAGDGEIKLSVVEGPQGAGIRVEARDRGPGIEDIPAAMTDGFSTGNSLGLGLPGTKRIVDEFEIHSEPGKGVLVTAVKWKLL